MPRVSATTPRRAAELALPAARMRGQGECWPLDRAMVEAVDRFLAFLADVPLYVIVAMGVALVYDAIRGLW